MCLSGLVEHSISKNLYRSDLTCTFYVLNASQAMKFHCKSFVSQQQNALWCNVKICLSFQAQNIYFYYFQCGKYQYGRRKGPEERKKMHGESFAFIQTTKNFYSLQNSLRFADVLFVHFILLLFNGRACMYAVGCDGAFQAWHLEYGTIWIFCRCFIWVLVIELYWQGSWTQSGRKFLSTSLLASASFYKWEKNSRQLNLVVDDKKKQRERDKEKESRSGCNHILHTADILNPPINFWNKLIFRS